MFPSHEKWALISLLSPSSLIGLVTPGQSSFEERKYCDGTSNRPSNPTSANQSLPSHGGCARSRSTVELDPIKWALTHHVASIPLYPGCR